MQCNATQRNVASPRREERNSSMFGVYSQRKIHQQQNQKCIIIKSPQKNHHKKWAVNILFLCIENVAKDYSCIILSWWLNNRVVIYIALLILLLYCLSFLNISVFFPLCSNSMSNFNSFYTFIRFVFVCFSFGVFFLLQLYTFHFRLPIIVAAAVAVEWSFLASLCVMMSECCILYNRIWLLNYNTFEQQQQQF